MNWQKLLTWLFLRGAAEYSENAKLREKVATSKFWIWIFVAVTAGPFYLMAFNEMVFGEGDTAKAQWALERAVSITTGGAAFVGLRQSNTKVAEKVEQVATKTESDLVAIARKAMEEMKANEK